MPRNVRRSLALAGLIALAAVPAACAHGHRAPSGADSTAPVVGVQIINHGASPVSISIDNGPGRQPLLVLGAHGVTSFEVPMRNLAESKVLRLSARQLGDARHVARVSARVSAGDQVVWTIEPTVVFSTVRAHARQIARRPVLQTKPSKTTPR
jgi:hypothetical protein